jgi:hypothetical protein
MSTNVDVDSNNDKEKDLLINLSSLSLFMLSQLISNDSSIVNIMMQSV